jgi:hypothetical protein
MATDLAFTQLDNSIDLQSKIAFEKLHLDFYYSLEIQIFIKNYRLDE